MRRFIRQLKKLYRLRTFEDRLRNLEDTLIKELGLLRSDVDLLKSSLEIPLEWINEYLEWKANTPLPKQPLVSVCVATYNRVRLLTERCIPSILSQSYRNLELIVVGDGCTDETTEAVSKITDPRLKFVNLLERGQYPMDPSFRWMVAGIPATNHALSLAQGDYITHLDDDDEYVWDRLEKLVDFAVQRQCDFVWHPFWWETEEGEWRLNESMCFAMNQVTTSSVFYRSWFKRIEWDPIAYRLREPGDWNRFRRIKYLNPNCARYPEPLLKHYRERNQSEPLPASLKVELAS